MKVVYLEYSENVENEVLQAYINKKVAEVSIGDTKLNMPMVLNVTIFKMDRLKKYLSHAVYKWLREFRTARNPTEAAMDKFGYRVQRIVKNAKVYQMDLLVIHDKDENIDLIRDEIKQWIRTVK